MAIKVLITRTINKDQEVAVRPFLKELRQCALKSKGYISGESLISADNLDEQLIISSWETRDDWESYLESEEAKEIRYKIDQTLGKSSVFKIYYVR